MPFTRNCSADAARLAERVSEAECVVVGAGAGLSTAAGFTYDGGRFRQYFSDFEKKYGFHDMYSGSFYPFPTAEERWAYMSRMIWVNRYQSPPKPVYEELYNLVKDKDYFVLTTNVDHCFQKGGFAKERLFYTQGDFGLFQCSLPCRQETFDNEDAVREMLRTQKDMRIPSELVPHCPHCGRPMTMNLRADGTFAEDGGWHRAQERYHSFLQTRAGKRVLFLELGVGYNTPVIIKFPFWQAVKENPRAFYACVNMGEAYCPQEIAQRSVCIDGDIGEVLQMLL